MMGRKLLILVLMLASMGCCALAQAAPAVVVTLKPVHALVSAVMGEVGAPILLLSGSENPHSYALRPADRRHLQNADLVVWIGPELEGFLTKALAADPQKGIRILQLPGLQTLAGRSAEIWNGAGHAHEQGGRVDPHVWLNPDNAQLIALHVAERLADIDPDNRSQYLANAKKLAVELMSLDAEIKSSLQSVRAEPYVVLHDAYQYFEQHFRLAAKGALRVFADRSAGARHISRLHALADAGDIRCVFADLRYPDKAARALARAGTVKLGWLDSVGVEVPAGPEAYAVVMRNMAEAIQACLD